MVSIDDQPWFVAADVCKVLDVYLHSDGKPNVAAACRKLEDGEQRMIPIHPSFGRTKVMRIISESGLYKLIMRSDKPQAKDFQDLVTKEILPSIRKTGAYVTATQ